MKLKLKQILASLLVLPVLAFGSGLVLTPSVLANAPTLKGDLQNIKSDDQVDSVDPSSSDLIKNIINWLLWAIGVISVIMIIFGGIRYATSGGDQNKVTSAKNTIMYAVIGLIVAILSYAIVQLVLNNI